MTVAFGLLGPVTMHLDGNAVALPAGRTQLLLAALLLNRGRRVSTKRLLGDLWDEPPPSASGNLRTYVTRLRSLLGPHRDRLVWVNAGYALAVEAGELDLDGFEVDIRDALDAVGRGRPEQSAQALAAGLRRWRGEAAEGLPRFGALGHSLDALDESRWVSVERHAAACAEAGQHRAAVAALRSLLADRPARESAWEALAQALVRLGERAEAMTALAAADAALRAGAGRGPGMVLREIERGLLERAPAAPGRPDAAPGDASPRTAPSSLPPAVVLIGRECLLNQIEATLGRAGAIVLHGPAGVGKSALAGAAAARLAPSFPRGQLYLDFCGSSPGLTPMTVEEATGSLLRALGGERSGGTAAAEAAELQARVGDGRMLLVLDNVLDAGQVRRLLSVLGTATVIVTSRTALPTLDVAHLAVGALAPDESVVLLARHAGTERIIAAPEEARVLADLCDHLPLALRIVGARLSSRPEWTLADMVARLTDEQFRLDELSCDDLAVRASLAVTADVLTERPGGPEAMDLFDRWGMVCPPAVGLELAQVLTGADAREVRALLDRLAAAGLVEACGTDRYRLHDLVRLYAMERGRRDPTTRAAAIHAARCHWLGTTRRAGDHLRRVPDRPADGFVEARPIVTFTDQREALRWLDRERENLVAAARAAARDGTAEGDLFAVRLCAELYPFLPMRGYYRELREVAQGALRCARRLGSRPDEATALTYFAVAQSRLGETDRAVNNLLIALALREADDDTQAVAVTLDHLGVLLAAAGRLDEARAAFLRALDLHRRRADRRRTGVTLNNLADVLLQLDQSDAALVHLQESLRLRQEIGDELGLGITILTIGQAYARSGRYRQAYGWLDRALTAARDTGNREAEWRVLTVRAKVHRDTGQQLTARDDLHHALAISEQTGDAIGADEVRRALTALRVPATPRRAAGQR
ncbi:BTAD domain-containing putative transcriptional regulator [Micromonospora sp. NPDC049240]|uniref:AfsR/SARP family transcriptional regulator n=1 Tax=Micromonospora sp. NPDC049240 TaxID=3155151 RepID=UPI0033F5C577